MYGASAVNREIADSCGQRLPALPFEAEIPLQSPFEGGFRGMYQPARSDNCGFNIPLNPPSKGDWHMKTPSNGNSLLLRRISLRPDNPVNPVILSKKGTRGFTLVELLVALSIFSILMTALVIIFVGALRTTQTGYQQMDAFERGRSALTVIENDLVRSHISHQSADLHSFYGTPIGMTFVGTTQMTSDPKDVNLARITYVIYNYNKMPEEDLPEDLRVPFEVLDEELREVVGYEYPYPLLRYVEPGVSDLDSFPINWNPDPDSSGRVLPPGSTTWVDIGVNFGQLLNLLCGQALGLSDPTTFDSISADLTKPQQDLVRSKKCEIWMRMLAGGDQQIPVNFWRDVRGYGKTDADTIYKDYVVTENVISSVPPDQRYAAPFDFDPYHPDPCAPDPCKPEKRYVFRYRCTPRSADLGVEDNVCCDCAQLMPPRACYWWRTSRLPEVVQVTLRLGFPSPYPGAPDFQRLFSLEVNLPTGYTRAPEL